MSNKRILVGVDSPATRVALLTAALAEVAARYPPVIVVSDVNAESDLFLCNAVKAFNDEVDMIKANNPNPRMITESWKSKRKKGRNR